MFELFQMWGLVEILGIIFLPLTVTIFYNMPDRGWAWSKALALLVSSFCVWLPLMVFHALFFDWSFIFCIVLLLLALNVFGFLRTRQTLWQIVRANKWYVITTEVLFFLMVLLLGWLRSFNPNIMIYERFMDEGFLASIMRSQHFPPSDMWYAGYSLNYYYYAHYIIAMLAKLSGQTPSIAFNTGISMLYGLTAVSLFGVTSNIIAWSRHYRAQQSTDQISAATQVGADHEIEPIYATKNTLLRGMPFAGLTVAMALMLGNLESAVLWWQEHNTAQMYGPYGWWFSVTRIIPNTINEFPAFSFLLSDFHAHVISLAFTILAIGFAFNFLLSQEGEGIFIFGRGWRLGLTLSCTAISMGGLYVMNGWDLPTYFGLVIVCIGVSQWFIQNKQINIKWLLNTLSAIIPLGALTALFYAPFFLGFVSPAQGIGIVPIADRSTLNQELLIYGLFAFIFISLLVSNIVRRFLPAYQSRSVATPKGQDSQESPEIEAIQNKQAEQAIDAESSEKYLSWPFIGIVSGLGFIMIGLIFQLINPPNTVLFITLGLTIIALVVVLQELNDRAHAFTLFLGTLAFALITACEVVFLRDVFTAQPRLNTVFKFYFQCWILLSIACGAGLSYILENTRVMTLLMAPRRAQRVEWNGGRMLWSACLILLLLAGCIYPIFAPYYRSASYDSTTNQAALLRTNSLDGMTYLQSDPILHGDYAAIRWLNANVTGTPVIVEAVGGDYSDYGRISAFTGLPTIMGWVGHEIQWRIEWINQSSANTISFDSRQTDVNDIYTDPNPQIVLTTMARYHAQYLYVGTLERQTYKTADLNRFVTFMQIVYKSSSVTIYKVRS